MTPVTDMVHNNLASLPDSGEVIQKLLELQKKPSQKERSCKHKRAVKYVWNDQGKVVFVHSKTKKLRVKVRVKKHKVFKQRVKTTKTFKKHLYPSRKTKC